MRSARLTHSLKLTLFLSITHTNTHTLEREGERHNERGSSFLPRRHKEGEGRDRQKERERDTAMDLKQIERLWETEVNEYFSSISFIFHLGCRENTQTPGCTHIYTVHMNNDSHTKRHIQNSIYTVYTLLHELKKRYFRKLSSN